MPPPTDRLSPKFPCSNLCNLELILATARLSLNPFNHRWKVALLSMSIMFKLYAIAYKMSRDSSNLGTGKC